MCFYTDACSVFQFLRLLFCTFSKRTEYSYIKALSEAIIRELKLKKAFFENVFMQTKLKRYFRRHFKAVILLMCTYKNFRLPLLLLFCEGHLRGRQLTSGSVLSLLQNSKG